MVSLIGCTHNFKLPVESPVYWPAAISCVLNILAVPITCVPMPSSVVASSTHNSEYVRVVAGTTSGVFVITLMTVAFIAVAGLVILYMRHKRSASREFLDGFGQVTMIEIGDELEVTMSSGSGGGKPFLQQRTIAKEVIVCDMMELSPRVTFTGFTHTHTPT